LLLIFPLAGAACRGARAKPLANGFCGIHRFSERLLDFKQLKNRIPLGYFCEGPGPVPARSGKYRCTINLSDQDTLSGSRFFIICEDPDAESPSLKASF